MACTPERIETLKLILVALDRSADAHRVSGQLSYPSERDSLGI